MSCSFSSRVSTPPPCDQRLVDLSHAVSVRFVSRSCPISGCGQSVAYYVLSERLTGRNYCTGSTEKYLSRDDASEIRCCRMLVEHDHPA